MEGNVTREMQCMKMKMEKNIIDAQTNK